MAESNIFMTEDFTTLARVASLVMNTCHMPIKSPIREIVREHTAQVRFIVMPSSW